MERLRRLKCTLYKEATRSEAILTFGSPRREGQIDLSGKMGFTRNYLVSLLLYASIVNEIRQHTVSRCLRILLFLPFYHFIRPLRDGNLEIH